MKCGNNKNNQLKFDELLTIKYTFIKCDYIFQFSEIRMKYFLRISIKCFKKVYRKHHFIYEKNDQI